MLQLYSLWFSKYTENLGDLHWLKILKKVDARKGQWHRRGSKEETNWNLLTWQLRMDMFAIAKALLCSLSGTVLER